MRGGSRKFGSKHCQAFWNAEKHFLEKHNRQPTMKEIWEALNAVADKANPNAAIHSVHKYHVECWTEDGAKKNEARISHELVENTAKIVRHVK